MPLKSFLVYFSYRIAPKIERYKIRVSLEEIVMQSLNFVVRYGSAPTQKQQRYILCFIPAAIATTYKSSKFLSCSKASGISANSLSSSSLKIFN